MPVKSKAQLRLMEAAAHGYGKSGISEKTAKEFIAKTPKKAIAKLPEKAGARKVAVKRKG